MGRDWHPQVYFAQHPEDKYIKIGYTINLQWRLWQLQSDYKVKLELLGVMEGDKDVERKRITCSSQNGGSVSGIVLVNAC